METKIKRLYKSFKYITQMFDMKEQEMEIGYPTDVKHVTHIGWDDSTESGPSWMSDFETASDFSTSFGNLGGSRDPNPKAMSIASWSSQDFEECTESLPTPSNYKVTPPIGPPLVPKKPTRKKVKLTSSSESLMASKRQSSRTAKSKGGYTEIEATPIAQARFKM